jgi:hypothetical protein
MSLEVVSVEVEKHHGTLPQWEDALSACVGRVPPQSREEEVTRALPLGAHSFSGRIEFARLGDGALYKFAATPSSFSSSFRTATTTLPTPVLLLLQLSGSCKFDQHNESCTLYPGDWCMIDTAHSLDAAASVKFEGLTLVLERPCDPEVRGLEMSGLVCFAAVDRRRC